MLLKTNASYKKEDKESSTIKLQQYQIHLDTRKYQQPLTDSQSRTIIGKGKSNFFSVETHNAVRYFAYHVLI